METHQEKLIGIVRYQLFGGAKPQIDENELPAIIKEASQQTVYTMIFPFLRDAIIKYSPEKFAQKNEQFLGNVLQNTANFFEHDELHRLMTENNIPYSAIKGLASAYYYPEASLRDMGDVDFLVRETDFERAKLAVMSIGFEIDHGEEDTSKHIAFQRKPLSIWEQHRSINGIPNNAAGKLIREEAERIIDTSVTVTLDGAVCRIPDTFHHGLIMLLHIISHMTSEGIGLRHLCDWAVFVERLGNDEFTELFEDKLKSFGLWRFAQIMTLVSQEYLGISEKKWAQNNSIDKKQLENVITDILNGGNFGKKDMNRYREIKYISNRGENTVDDKSIVSQGLSTLNRKVYNDYGWIDRHRFFLPIGWVAEGGKYIGLLITGKRKNKGTSVMLREAAKRKDIYSQMQLFETE